MAVLLQIRDAHKSYGSQVLLDGAEASITDDGKVGFVGRNGAGKSTLLKVLLGEEELETGDVIRHPRLRLGYLRQHDPFQPGETALQFLMRDSGQPDWKCGEVAGQFEIKGDYLDGPIAKLSGGWQTRVKLAALLLHEPNLLLLDEPTNFLDLRTQILLEHFLRNYKEACLIVSHDREFLRATCDTTLDLTRGKLTMFPGKIDAFLAFQEERKQTLERTNATVQMKMKQLETFIAKNKARASTAAQARNKSKQLERLEVHEIESEEPTVSIRPPQVEARKGTALRCVDLSIGYADREIAKDINVDVDHGSRAAIVGDNGQGKRLSCGRWSTRCSRSRARFAGARGARSASMPSTSTPACRPSRRSMSTWKSMPRSAPRCRRSSTQRLHCCSAGTTSTRRFRCCREANAPGCAWRV